MNFLKKPLHESNILNHQGSNLEYLRDCINFESSYLTDLKLLFSILERDYYYLTGESKELCWALKEQVQKTIWRMEK